MKKTIATSLLLILIFSCVFSFAACSSTDPIVGKYYRELSSGKYDSAYLVVRKDGTATIFWCKKETSTLGERDDYTSWMFDKETNTYSFSGRYGQGNTPDIWTLVNGNLQDPKVEQHKYIRISDSAWPDWLPKE